MRLFEDASSRLRNISAVPHRAKDYLRSSRPDYGNRLSNRSQRQALVGALFTRVTGALRCLLDRGAPSQAKPAVPRILCCFRGY